MEIIALGAGVLLYQIFWYLFIKDFKVKNMWYIISVALTFVILGGYYYFHNGIGIELLPYALNLVILINLSIIDCEYFEISGKSYWYLFFPTIAILILNYPIMLEHLISFIIIFSIFWIIDKIVGVEKIGGADVKILMILALTVSFFDSITLLGLSFVFDVFFFMVKFPIDKIRGKTERTKIPMIVSITLAWIIASLMNFTI